MLPTIEFVIFIFRKLLVFCIVEFAFKDVHDRYLYSSLQKDIENLSKIWFTYSLKTKYCLTMSNIRSTSVKCCDLALFIVFFGYFGEFCDFIVIVNLSLCTMILRIGRYYNLLLFFS